jgi:hypothetical protein
MRKALAVGAEVESFVKGALGVTWFKPSEEDKLRLLIFAQWRERYRLSIPLMLTWLIPIWRERFTKFKKGNSIGVSISTLTGRKSEEILKKKLEESFPDQENLKNWRSHEQAAQWARFWDKLPMKEDWEFPGDMVRKYQERMMSERRHRNKFAKEQQRRRYRNNPWVL